jgi:hypothetical protein
MSALNGNRRMAMGRARRAQTRKMQEANAEKKRAARIPVFAPAPKWTDAEEAARDLASALGMMA